MLNVQKVRHVMLRGMAGVVVLLTSGCCGPRGWRAQLGAELPAFGHRNWIVVADSAYPKQSAPGIETIATGEGQLEVLEYVLNEIEKAPHIQAIVLLDAELESVPEEDAPGIGAYRAALGILLEGKKVTVLPHEEIIAKLDEGAKLFNTLLLKTNMVLPYTTVFLELDCGYWGAEKEKRLRSAIEGKK